MIKHSLRKVISIAVQSYSFFNMVYNLNFGNKNKYSTRNLNYCHLIKLINWTLIAQWLTLIANKLFDSSNSDHFKQFHIVKYCALPYEENLYIIA